MAGSSAFQFGRAAYKAGLVTRRQLARGRVGERPLPPARLDRRRHRRAARADRRDARRRARARPAAARARRARRRAAAAVPADARDRLRAPGRRPADLHLHRRLAGDGGADGDRADVRRRGRLGRPRSSTATTPAAPAGRSPTARARRRRSATLAEREGIDLAASWAYSDSESDLPMLRLVGHPVAVNPDAELGRVARDEGWEVLRFERLGRRLRVARRRGRRRRRSAGSARSCSRAARRRRAGAPTSIPLRRR